MTTSKTKRSANAGEPRLSLPPGFHAMGFRELKHAFGEAMRLAGEEGGGLVTFIHRFDTVEFAVVIEPDEPLSAARCALYAAMNALADAISVHCPPERPLTFDWPDTIRLDGGIIGGVRLGWPEGAGEDDIPDWLVIGAMVRLFIPLHADGGHALDMPFTEGTSLASEGFEMLDGATLIEGFCRHLLVYADQWQERGFAPVGKHYLERLGRAVGTERLAQRGIAPNGDLIWRARKGVEAPQSRSLRQALTQPQWLDDDISAPRL